MNFIYCHHIHCRKNKVLLKNLLTIQIIKKCYIFYFKIFNSSQIVGSFYLWETILLIVLATDYKRRQYFLKTISIKSCFKWECSTYEIGPWRIIISESTLIKNSKDTKLLLSIVWKAWARYLLKLNLRIQSLFKHKRECMFFRFHYFQKLTSSFHKFR